MQMRVKYPSLNMDLAHWLRAKLQDIPPLKVLILGIGNSLKADDGVGCFICEKLKPSMPGRVIDASTVPENYIQKIVNLSPQILLIIDAMDFGGTPGQIRFFSMNEVPSSSSSTHALNPQLFADLIQKQCNTEIYYIGIQPQSVAIGLPMSPLIEEAAYECIRCFNILFK